MKVSKVIGKRIRSVTQVRFRDDIGEQHHVGEIEMEDGTRICLIASPMYLNGAREESGIKMTAKEWEKSRSLGYAYWHDCEYFVMGIVD